MIAFPDEMMLIILSRISGGIMALIMLKMTHKRVASVRRMCSLRAKSTIEETELYFLCILFSSRFSEI